MRMSFDPLSPIELMSLGDRERVHTALLAWLLGEHSPLEPGRRGQLAGMLAGEAAWEVTRTSSRTEVKHLDVLVALESDAQTRLLAIEAKLKSREHSSQLARYDVDLAAQGHRCAKVFLTLIGDDPESGTGWRAVSYAQLAAAVRLATTGAAGANLYVVDYMGMLERLALAARVASSSAGARVAFGESTEEVPEHAGFVAYVSHLRLQKLLQQVWMSELRAAVLREWASGLPAGWHSEIDETNGAALLNFLTTTLHPGYCVGLQLQHRSCKMFCYPVTSKDTRPTAEQIRGAAAVLEQARVCAGVDARPSATRSQGFTSVTLVKIAGAERDLATWAKAVGGALRTTVDAMAAGQPARSHGVTSPG